jgi:hypothetical protein
LISNKIHVEITIPLRNRDGSLIEFSKHRQTKDEIINKFGAGNFLTTSEGAWKDYSENNRIDIDVNTVFYVDVDYTEDNISFFKNYKNELRKRYYQKEIYISWHRLNGVL